MASIEKRNQFFMALLLMIDQQGYLYTILTIGSYYLSNRKFLWNDRSCKYLTSRIIPVSPYRKRLFADFLTGGAVRFRLVRPRSPVSSQWTHLRLGRHEWEFSALP